jgi:hypothetical protein
MKGTKWICGLILSLKERCNLRWTPTTTIKFYNAIVVDLSSLTNFTCTCAEHCLYWHQFAFVFWIHPLDSKIAPNYFFLNTQHWSSIPPSEDSSVKVEKSNSVNDHYWCTRLRVEWFLCGSKMVNHKSGGPK